MITTVLIGLVFLVAIALVIFGNFIRKSSDQHNDNRGFGIGVASIGAVFFLIGGIWLWFASTYTQDVGEAKVVVTWDGKISGYTTENQLHFKAPWESTRTFDVRNNIVTFAGSQDEPDPMYAGNPRTGTQITFQDREGVSGNVDVTVRYALDPDSVVDIYKNFRTQEQLVSKVINDAIRGEVRKVTVTRNTIEVYNQRADLEAELFDLLAETITIEGFRLEAVTMQEIDYGPVIQQRFEDAQAARVEVDKAEAEKEAAGVRAETKVVEAKGVADAAVEEAKGQAEANRLLTESLSDEILQQRYIDALKDGTVFVVPDGSQPLVSTTK